MARPPVSVCIITKDEERNLPDCLASVRWAEEILVVDSHSRDRTREIAAAAGARVIERDFPGHVEQKNFAVDSASHGWILSLDADERLTPELAASIQRALERPDPPDGFEFARRTFHLGRWIRHGGWYPDRKIRLFRRDRGRWGGENPHDRVELKGRAERLPGDLLHYSFPDLSAHVRQVDFFTTIAARAMQARGRRFRLHALLLRPPAKFLKMYLLQAGFLDGVPGLVLATTGAYYVLLKHAKLWEMERAGRKAGE